MDCVKCGKPLPEDALFCPECGTAVEQAPEAVTELPEQPAETETVQEEVPEKKERVLLGTLGALAGALLGGAAIILVNRLGYNGQFCGILLGMCILLGYELLGGKLGSKGLLISLILVLVTPFVADLLDWALVLALNVTDFTVLDGVATVFTLLANGTIELASYIKGLVTIYFFTFLGGFVTMLLLLWDRKK